MAATLPKPKQNENMFHSSRLEHQHQIAHQELAQHRHRRQPPRPSGVVARKCGDRGAGARGPVQTVGGGHREQRRPVVVFGRMTVFARIAGGGALAAQVVASGPSRARRTGPARRCRTAPPARPAWSPAASRRRAARAAARARRHWTTSRCPPSRRRTAAPCPTRGRTSPGLAAAESRPGRVHLARGPVRHRCSGHRHRRTPPRSIPARRRRRAACGPAGGSPCVASHRSPTIAAVSAASAP